MLHHLNSFQFIFIKTKPNIYTSTGFLGGVSGKELACQCRRHKRGGSLPSLGKIPWRRAWWPSSILAWRISWFCSQPRLKWLSMHTLLHMHTLCCLHFFILVAKLDILVVSQKKKSRKFLEKNSDFFFFLTAGNTKVPSCKNEWWTHWIDYIQSRFKILKFWSHCLYSNLWASPNVPGHLFMQLSLIKH